MDPRELQKVRESASRAISPLQPAPLSGDSVQDLVFKCQRTKAGRDLPPYYLVYFLLVELLKFPNRGRWEKTAWSIPVEFNRTAYLIEHRKLGLGVFAVPGNDTEERAEHIVKLIKKGVNAADPYFRWLAEKAVAKPSLNVENNSHWLFARYRYLYELFGRTSAEAEARQQDIRNAPAGPNLADFTSWNTRLQLSRQASWLGLAAIDAFFSWTEHIFVHLAILTGHLKTGNEVAERAGADWNLKFKFVLDLNNPETKKYYDQLVKVKRQLRDYTTHGAFGKQRQAFKFHSRVGAVPVMLNDERTAGRFSIYGAPVIEEGPALAIIEDFINHLWTGPLALAKSYLQDSGLPLILTFANDGTYARAMSSPDEMETLIEGLSAGFDNAANMDW